MSWVLVSKKKRLENSRRRCTVSPVATIQRRENARNYPPFDFYSRVWDEANSDTRMQSEGLMGQLSRDEHHEEKREVHGSFAGSSQIWVVSVNASVEIATKSSSIARHSFPVLSFFSCERQRGNAEEPIARINGGAPKAEESTRGGDQLACWFLLYRPRIAGLLLDPGIKLRKRRWPERLWDPSHEMRRRK